MYITTRILLSVDYAGPIILPYLMGAVFGIVMGLFEWCPDRIFSDSPHSLLHWVLPGLYIGIMQGVLAAHELPVPPAMFCPWQSKAVFRLQCGGWGSVPICLWTIFILIFFLLVTFLLLRFTMLGRGIYALGGDEVSAQRAGFNILGIKLFIYSYVGLIAGIAGIARACMMRNCHPTNLLGIEMIVIAAVVLGGTRVNRWFWVP